MKIKPDKHEAWYNRGIALKDLGRLEEAIASCDKALEIKPDNDQAWVNRGFALKNLGRLEEAIASYEQAVKIKPDYHQAWYNKACYYPLQGNVEFDFGCRSILFTSFLTREYLTKINPISEYEQSNQTIPSEMSAGVLPPSIQDTLRKTY